MNAYVEKLKVQIAELERAADPQGGIQIRVRYPDGRIEPEADPRRSVVIVDEIDLKL